MFTKMDNHSPEMERTLTVIADQTRKGVLRWQVLDYDPIGFMTETGVDSEDSETENFSQSAVFLCPLRKGRRICLEVYESLGFPVLPAGPGEEETPSCIPCLRGLGYYTLHFLSAGGKVLYHSGTIVHNRKQQLPLCLLADAVFACTMGAFREMPQNHPEPFMDYLHRQDNSGQLESHPLSLLMTDFYQYNRSRDFHLLAMACTNGP